MFGQMTPGKSCAVLNDGSGTISITGCPETLAGLVEVRGVCEKTGWMEAKSFVSFPEDQFDTVEYAKIVGVISRSDRDYATWTTSRSAARD